MGRERAEEAAEELEPDEDDDDDEEWFSWVLEEKGKGRMGEKSVESETGRRRV